MIRMAHLETDITTACECACISCNHLVPIWRKAGVWRSDPDQVARDLNHLSSIMHADAWGALGGEPTLHPELPAILKIVRESGIADTIQVWTNGILLSNINNKLSRRFWDESQGLFDELVLSRYEGKLSDSDVDFISYACGLAGIRLTIKDERTWHNFRTNLEPEPTDPATTKAKFDGCFFRQFSRVANRGFFYTCCCSPQMPVLLQGRPHGSDGIAIDKYLTEEALSSYLTRSEPLGCCTICAGRDTAKPIQWGEERDPEKWLQKSRGLEILPT